MIIGVDLDNTIINHKKSFKISYEYFFKKKKIPKILNDDYKTHLKNNLSNTDWIKTQENVYSKFLTKYGRFYRGFKKFLLRSQILNHKLFIISHKSKYSLNNKINLHDPAYLFLNKINIEKKQILFFKNFKKKIEYINTHKFSYFIDDLLSVINSINIGSKKKILFSDKKINRTSQNLCLASWSEIEDYIFGECKVVEIKKYLKLYYFYQFKIERLFKSHNSVVLKIKLKNSKVYKLKISNHRDQRIKKEFKLIKNLNSIQKFIHPNPIKFDLNYKFSIYEWIEGNSPKVFNKIFIDKLILYLKSINEKKITNFDYIDTDASSSCFSYSEVFSQIENRLNSFYILDDIKINSHLEEIKLFYQYLKKSLVIEQYKKFPKRELIFSPSDLSLKNFINYNNHIIFIDYEYFGRDNAVKLLCDIILHPYNNLDLKHSQYLYKKFNYNFIKVNHIRFRNCFYLYGLIWCMIILNPLKRSISNLKALDKSKKFFYNLKLKYDQKYLDEITTI